ncbi:hypothetical protein Hanom_Chr12g01081981 [Helianthus anomalus]
MSFVMLTKTTTKSTHRNPRRRRLCRLFSVANSVDGSDCRFLRTLGLVVFCGLNVIVFGR